MSEKHPVAFASCTDYANVRAAIDQVLAPQLAMRGPVTGKSIMLKPNLLAWRRKQDPGICFGKIPCIVDFDSVNLVKRKGPGVCNARQE